LLPKKAILSDSVTIKCTEPVKRILNISADIFLVNVRAIAGRLPLSTTPYMMVIGNDEFDIKKMCKYANNLTERARVCQSTCPL